MNRILLLLIAAATLPALPTRSCAACAETWSLSFAAPGDDVESALPATLEVMTNSIVTLPSGAASSRDGSTFAGWFDGSHLHDPGDLFRMPMRDVTMTAQWRSLDAATLFPLSVDLFQAGDNGSIATVFANDADLPDVIVVGEKLNEVDPDDSGPVFTILYVNRGNGQFEASEQSDFGNEADEVFDGVDDAWIAVADVDGDRDEDIFIVGDPDRDIGGDERSSASAILYLSDGDGTFHPQYAFRLRGGHDRRSGCAVNRWNGVHRRGGSVGRVLRRR